MAKAAHPPKYYIYISSSKVAMLADQLSTNHPTKRETSIRIDMKIFHWSQKRTVEGISSLMAKLMEIIALLKQMSQVGTINNPLAYIEGTLPLRWGLFNIGDNHPLRDLGDKAPVVFCGQQNEKKILMYGSPVHLIGREIPPTVPALWSGSDVVQYFLDSLNQQNQFPSEDEFISGISHSIRASTTYDRVSFLWKRVFANLSNPEQDLDFFAKTLFYHQGKSRNAIIVASPLYVALGGSKQDRG